MEKKNTLIINKKECVISGERNVLEVARKSGVDIPTFCYHSELSIYGACRLCLVDIEGRGIVTSCSTKPEPGLIIRTHTDEIRQMRKLGVELLLAGHEQNCPSCPKGSGCELQRLSRLMGVDKVRFKPSHVAKPVDRSSPSLIRDPNKCILCGDCVRACSEIQGVGAIDFAYRGSNTAVLPAFGKDLAEVECVNCGLCASVCPTGSLTPNPQIDDVWKALNNPAKKVVAQVAPAVRVAVGEAFGLEAGGVEMGRIVAALKGLGFHAVYDTSFSADMTVVEESAEFLARKTKGEKLPLLTSCCPAWVKFAEQFYPELMGNLSSCRSPQQMFGSVAKEILPSQFKVKREDLIVVSVMPCTAKKYEAKLNKFTVDSVPDVDFVLSTQELASMIQEAGIDFKALQPESLDMPFGFKSGAGVIFGSSGGVTEAVLRYAVEKIKGDTLEATEFKEVRGESGIRQAEIVADGVTLKLAIVSGLANARIVLDRVKSGEASFDLIEVMACPGGCVVGAGQPVSRERAEVCKQRTSGLYQADRMLELHKSQENHLLSECYAKHLGGEGSHKTHELLHTKYQSRRRISGEPISIVSGGATQLVVSVCVGTNCFLRGSDALIRKLTAAIEAEGLSARVHVQATFCFEKCGEAPNVKVGEVLVSKATVEKVMAAIRQAMPLMVEGAVS